MRLVKFATREIHGPKMDDMYINPEHVSAVESRANAGMVKACIHVNGRPICYVAETASEVVAMLGAE